MENYFEDEYGKWEDRGDGVRFLIEPSELYIKEDNELIQANEDFHALEKLKPTNEERLMAQFDIRLITLLEGRN